MIKIKKLFSWLLLLFFLLGIAPFSSGIIRPSEARTKKLLHRAKFKKHHYKTRGKKFYRKAKKIYRRQYRPPVRKGLISQRYFLEEGSNPAENQAVITELNILGITDANIDAEKNTLQIKFNTQKLSSIDVIKKLKELGYTVKRID